MPAYRVTVFGIWFLLAWTLNLAAAAVVAPTALADSLFENGRYYDAATEYERVLFRHSQSTDSADFTDSSGANQGSIRQVRLKLVQAHARGGEIDKAEGLLVELSGSGDSAEWAARFDLAMGYLEQRDYASARSEWLNLLAVTRDSARQRRLRRQSAWLSVETGDFGQAAEEFALAGDSAPAAECRGLTRLPARDPGLAMLVSTVIPGSGELYDGRVGLGLTSFAVNAAVIAGVVYCVDRKFYLDAALLAEVLFGRFYSGSRSNAYDLARDFNTRIRKKAADDLKRRYSRE
jgi:tetratricopeptide (TPR) repeat protein